MEHRWGANRVRAFALTRRTIAKAPLAGWATVEDRREGASCIWYTTGGH